MFKMATKEMAGQKATLWSNEEVQTFLCIMAEEKVQRQLDGQIQNENVYIEDAEMKLPGYQRPQQLKY